MAFSNTYNTTNQGSAVSNNEDLSDLLTVLEPMETPFLSLARKEKAKAVSHDWTVDKMRLPTTAGAREGEDVSEFEDKHKGRARLANYCQEWKDSFMVSNWQEAVDSVGPAKLAEAEVKTMREVKRDIEATLLSGNDRVLSDGIVAGKLRGLDDWLDSAGPSDVPADYRTPAGSIHASGTLTESVFNDLITSIYRQSGEYQNLTYIADTAARRTISNFARAEGTTTATPYTVNQNASEKKITLTVSLYESDNGMVSIINMNPVCAPDTTNKDYGFLVNTSKYAYAELQPMKSELLENQGGGKRGYVSAIGTLVVDHPQAHGKNTVIA